MIANLDNYLIKRPLVSKTFEKPDSNCFFLSSWTLIKSCQVRRSLRNGRNFNGLSRQTDVIARAPDAVAVVRFTSGSEAKNGNILTPTLVKDAPSVEWPVDKNAFYTLLMVDPDAPSRTDPTMRNWLHWLIVNIPNGMVEKGEVLAGYIGSGPPAGSGLHRYVFLVYKQSGWLPFSRERKIPANSAEKRDEFSVQKFVDYFKLGEPVAGNFYQAAYDDYVPKLYATLSKL
jgi:phosphatidylethanolamine-binding protein